MTLVNKKGKLFWYI